MISKWLSLQCPGSCHERISRHPIGCYRSESPNSPPGPGKGRMNATLNPGINQSGRSQARRVLKDDFDWRFRSDRRLSADKRWPWKTQEREVLLLDRR